MFTCSPPEAELRQGAGEKVGGGPGSHEEHADQSWVQHKSETSHYAGARENASSRIRDDDDGEQKEEKGVCVCVCMCRLVCVCV